MKKLVSLLLAVIMTVGLLSGIALAAYEMPTQCDEANAGVVVTCTGDTSAKYYFENLTNELVSWACHDLKGDKIITLLKDLQPVNPSDTSAQFIYIPGNLADWEGNRAGKDELIIDLNEKTLTFQSQSNLFKVTRYGFTLKNGTVLYTCVGANRCPIMIGGSKDRTATSSGTTLWTPKVNIENANIFVLTDGSGGAVFQNYVFGSQISITNSLLYTNGWTAIMARATNQEQAADKPYQGDYVATLNVTGSTIVSRNDYAIAGEGEAPMTVTLSDSTLVSNHKKGGMLSSKTPLVLDNGGTEPTEIAGWSRESVIGALTGTAYQFGDAVGDAKMELPFEDVKEGDWFYEFVAEMYAQGIINGMTETTFVPNGTLTYGQALKLIAVGMGEGEQPAMNGHWAGGYVKLAKDKGWITEDVDPNGAVSRLAFCRIAAAAKGLTEQPASNPFTDTDDTSVLALVNAGVINGMSETTFAPDQTLTRAQIAKILSLLLK